MTTPLDYLLSPRFLRSEAAPNLLFVEGWNDDDYQIEVWGVGQQIENDTALLTQMTKAYAEPPDSALDIAYGIAYVDGLEEQFSARWDLTPVKLTWDEYAELVTRAGQ